MLCEESHRPGISCGITRCEALVSHVKNGEVTLPFYNFKDFLPFKFSRIEASWVVSAGLQQNNRAVSRIGNIFKHPAHVKSIRLIVIVSITFHLKISALRNCVMGLRCGLRNL
jgi:hypothetical protein